MFDQILDNFRKATESTIQLQQELTRQWFQQWASIPGLPTPGIKFGTTGAAAPVASATKQISGAVTELLDKHLKTLDAQYRAGIRTIEDAFRVMEAKDLEQFRKLTEELWRQSFNSLKAVIESQLRDFQAATEKGIEAVSKGMPSIKS
ncbi:MAG: hypothetical protein JO252_19395 [Planctomycetaceae bacterium]|nr:hypothetical protein [Planctomycetaceae bacterium]